MLGLNGGLIGVLRVPTTAASAGMWSQNEQSVARRAGIWPALFNGDQYFAYNSLLLHMDGNNGSAIFSDDSINRLFITANGNAQISTAQSKFGGTSGLFDGAGDSLSTTNISPFRIGTEDFTVEAWVYITSLATYQGIIDCRPSASFSNYVFGIYNVSGVLRLDHVNAGGGGTRLTGTTTSVSLNTWTHVAWTRLSGVIYCFVNGVRDASSVTYSSALDPAGSTVYVGAVVDPLYLNGYVDELRVTRGIARYATSFTPFAAPFPNFGIAGPEDPYFSSVSMLLHMDGVNGSTTFTDVSGNALAITANGNAQISTAQSKWGGASGAFDGAGDYLSTPSNTAFNFDTNDFTIEAWVWLNSTTGDWFLVSSSATGGFFFGYASSQSPPGWGVGRVATAWDHLSGATISLSTWHHVAVCRSGTSLRFFVNGVQVGSTFTNSKSYNAGTGSLNISSQGANYYLNGYVDDLRITKSALYTANFTPPTAPFPDNGYLVDPYWSTVSLLLRMDGSNGSTTFTDVSRNALSVTANGNAQISTAQSKWGGASAFFNGASDSLTFIDPALGTGSFTIEMWIKTNSSVQYAQLIGNEGGSAGYTFLVNNNSATGGQLALYVSGALVASSSSGDWSDDAWHHIALTRSGNTFTIWADGTSVGTGTSSANMNGTVLTHVGRNNAFGPRNMVGYIDDLRITKSVARYTANFTPPTATHLGGAV